MTSAPSLLRNRNFAPFFAGNCVSNCGAWMQDLAQAVLIYRLTGSVLWVGIANFALYGGVLLLAPWAGAAADRFDRRRLLILTQLAAGAISGGMAGLVLSGAVTPAAVVACAVALGLTMAFALPARQALVPSLMGPDQLARAVGLDVITFSLARVAGPVLAALVISSVGIGWAFALNSVSYLVLLAGLSVVRPLSAPLRGHGRPGGLGETLRLVRGDRGLLVLLMVAAAISVSQDPVATLAPAFATQILERSDAVTGYLVGAFGVGALLAAWFALRDSRTPHRRMAATLATMAVGIVGFALADDLVVSLASLAVGGFGFLASQVRAVSMLQLRLDDRQRGRVMALWTVAFIGTRPLASLLDGALASVVGLRASALAFAAPALAAAVIVATVHVRAPRAAPAGSPAPDR